MTGSVAGLSCLALVVGLGILPSVMEAQELVWRDARQLTLEGQGWTEADSPYARLPAKAKGVVPESVWGLSRHSAGLCARFRTDAPQVTVRWTLLSGSLAMPHMPATGVSGVDLYVRDSTGRWRFTQNGRPEGESNTAALHTGGEATGMRECLLYLPLYNGVKSLEIGVPSDRKLEKAAALPQENRPLVIYGTSIVQGGCASRPGMAWTAILGRLLDRPVINMGFSGAGRMEAEVADFLAELDPAIYIVDCLWNMGDMDEAALTGRIRALVTRLRRAHPRTPLLFVGQSLLRPEAHPTPLSLFQQKAVRALQAEGISGLYLADGAKLLGRDGEGTVDGVHPNDLGMMRQAESLLPVVRPLLKP